MSEPQVPLARLFAMAFRSLIDELHAQLRERGFRDIRPAFGFVLLSARDQATTVNDVAALMGMTKQAASKLIDVMESANYVRKVEHPEDSRARLIALTARGQRLLATVEDIYRELESDWVKVIGKQRVDALRGDIVRVLRASHDGELPAVKPSW
jgi:DNA-binding MarR family transcriptional regulator